MERDQEIVTLLDTTRTSAKQAEERLDEIGHWKAAYEATKAERDEVERKLAAVQQEIERLRSEMYRRGWALDYVRDRPGGM